MKTRSMFTSLLLLALGLAAYSPKAIAAPVAVFSF
jgi:hypothetical protein